MYKNILVAIEPGDGSARQVLGAARELVEPNAEIQVLFVMDIQEFAFYLDPTYTGSAADVLRERFVRAARQVLADRCQPFKIPTDHQLVVIGDPAGKIQETAQALDCDLILMGTHGQRGWRRLLGSVASEVLRGHTLDVYLVKVQSTEAV